MEKVHCYLKESCLEVRDDTVSYYNIEQDNYVLLAADDVSGDYAIKISAEWGQDAHHLTIRYRAGEILCQTGYGWKAEYIEREAEDYWLITRTGDSCQYDACFYIRLSNLKIYRAGVARLALCYTKDGTDGPLSYVQLRKVPPALRIERFEPERGTVTPAAKDGKSSAFARLTWCVLGADRCMLNPGNKEVPPAGAETVLVSNTEAYTLSAFSGGKSVEKCTYIYWYEDVNHDTFQVTPHKYYADCPTTLEWNIKGNVREIQLLKDGELAAVDLKCTENQTRLLGGAVYTLKFIRDGKMEELRYEREMDERVCILQFQAKYNERQDAFHIIWETYYALHVKLFVSFRRRAVNDRKPELDELPEPDRGRTAAEKNGYVNSLEFLPISSKWRGDEWWRLEHDDRFPVYFILQAENVYKERVERHIEYRT